MRAHRSEHGGTKLWLSADETYGWAHRPGASWPGSTLSGRRLFVEFDARGDLVDFALNGRSDAECDAHELSALTSDFLRKRFGPKHPAIRDASPERFAE